MLDRFSVWVREKAGCSTLRGGIAVGALLVSSVSLFASPVAAADVEGSAAKPQTIYLVDRDGNETSIGTVGFNEESDGTSSFRVDLSEAPFVEKFLSMRPFKCIDGTKQTVCHLPYPYALKNRIGNGDLADLEYRLLFLHKGPTEYGIDAWNGLYYRLARNDSGGFDGALHEADFNILAVPPEAGVTRPIKQADLTAAEAGRHRFPRLVIR